MSGRLARTTWGPWPAVRLEDEAVALLAVPDLGGRVVSLLDRRSGREWLVQGEPPSAEEAAAWAAEEVVFDGRTSFGWDECLPSVAPAPDPVVPGAPPLRDHGDQWGRPSVPWLGEEEGQLEETFASPRWPYAFDRRLSLTGEGVLAEYRLRSEAERALPVLWSMHPVFAFEPGTRIDLGGTDGVRLTWANGVTLAPADRVPWPELRTDDGRSLDLSRVPGPEGWAAKLYAEGPPLVRAVTPDGAALELEWHREVAPALGIWLSAGGWPVGGPPAEQAALEPTTSPDDDLGDALAHGRALILEPGATRTWWVRMTLRPPG